MEITAAMIKELRDRTGIGFGDCKKALVEAEGDMENAIRILKEKGAIKAAKKADREVKDGVIGFYESENGKKAALVEVLCETDFVAQNENFQTFADSLAEHVVKSGDTPENAEALLEQTFHTNDKGLVKDYVNETIQKIGENITPGNVYVMEVEGTGRVGNYIHFNKKTAILTSATCQKEETASSEALKTLLKEISMHIASDSPLAVSSDEIDEASAKEQREIFVKNTIESGKPENMVEKIVEGRMNKWYKEVCLMDQSFFTGDKEKGTIKEMTDKVAKEFGDEITVKAFVRVQIGG